jgi:prostamide/prostaglandin F2alpha synthase
VPDARPIGDASVLADIVLPDQDGTEVRLGDLWEQRPVALVWLRHYG